MNQALRVRIGSYNGVNMWGVALRPTRTYLAVDSSGVTVAEIAEGRSGGLRALAHEPLPKGALLPRASGTNLADPEAVRAAAARALGAPGRSARLVLPDGVARLSLFEPPKGTPARDFVRFRLAPSLPWPAAEGVFDTLDAGSGRVVGAVVRRSTVAEYEAVARAAGASVEEVNLAPLMALNGLRRARRADGAHALLGDAAMCLVLVHEGRIVSLRSRRRDRSAGEAARLRAELERLSAAVANGNGGVPLAVLGSDAALLRPGLASEAVGAPVAPTLAGGGEAGWLVGLVA
jgi:hypothetical protein